MPPLADTATWIAVGFAVGAAVLALTASLVLLGLVLRRGRTAVEPPLPAPVEEPGADELEAALEHARGETARSQALAEIATSIDLDAVLQRTLAAAAATDGVAAAMAVVRQTEETPVVATFGMSA